MSDDRMHDVLPAMVHIAVPDADRAMRFFGALFDWQAERVEWQGHVRHYLVNTTGPQPVLTDEADAPAVRLGFTVADVGLAIQTITSAGGVVQQTGRSGDTGGWALADDGEGIALVVWEPGEAHEHQPSTKPAGAELEYLWLVVRDAARAREFYGSLVGWHLEQHTEGPYHHVVDAHGDVRATVVESPDGTGVKLFFTVADLAGATNAVHDLGGTADEQYDIGPGRASDCTDDQGTAFSLYAHHAS